MTLLETGKLRQLCDHFAKAPGVMRSWLNPNRVDYCIREALSASSQCRELMELERKTGELFGDRNTWPGFDDLNLKINELGKPEVSSAVTVFLGSNWKEEIPVDVEREIKIIDDLHSVLIELDKDVSEAKSQTGGYPAASWINLTNLCQIVEDIVELCPVPVTWVSEGHQIAREIERLRDLSTKIANRKQKLAEVFIDSFLEEIEPALSTRYRTNYQGIFRILRPQYWRDRRFMKGHMKSLIRCP